MTNGSGGTHGSGVRLTDRVAIVTGAGSGIGSATAERLAAEGAAVVVADVDEAGAGGTVRRIEQRGGRAIAAVVDVSDLAALDHLMERTLGAFAGLDVLVNNAGITRSLDFFEVSAEDWDDIHAVNARGAFFCMQAAARVMADAGGGAIVNVSSIAGKGYRATSSIAYAASKGAVTIMTRTAASQLAPFGVRVNSVCPGVTMTPLVDGIIAARSSASGRDPADHLDALRATIPLGRENTPADVAAVIAFLASEDARNVTGQSINVDGGMVFD